MDHSTTPNVRLAASSLAVWAGLITLYFVWGSTYIGIRIAVESIPPFIMAGTRFLLAAILLFVLSLVVEGRIVQAPSRREWRDSAIVGAALLGGGMGMVGLGERSVPSGITALLIALLPVWVAVIGRIVFRERLPLLTVLGIVIGIVGVGILVAPTGGTLAINPGGLAAVLISPIAWASGSLYSSHRARLPSRPVLGTAMQMLAGAATLAVMALVSGELAGFDIGAITGRSLLALAYLVTVGSAIGYTTYVWLLRVAPLPKIATYAYVNPVVAFILGAVILGEPFSPRTIVAAIVIVFAVALIVTTRSRSSSADAESVPAEVVARTDRPADALSAREPGPMAGGVRPVIPD